MAVVVSREKAPIVAAACAGAAAWVSIGSLAVANTDGGLTRVGILPPLWLLPGLVLGFAGIAWATHLSKTTSLPLFFSLILLLPWLPGSVPTVFLLWTDRVAVAVWLGVIVAVVAANRGGRSFSSGAAEKDSRPLFVAAVAAFALYLAAGWTLGAARTIPYGDEPHYLVITQSLLRDRDLQIENNHARGDYREYFDRLLPPDYLRRGVNGQIYSIHAPGLPAVVAPVYALFGYPGVVIFLSMIAALGSALLWRASYVLTESRSAAWFGWAAGALTVPFFFEAFAVFPDGLGATVILFAALPLLHDTVRLKPDTTYGVSVVSGFSRTRWIAIGAALGLLPWLHTRFAIISAVLGFLLLLRLVRLKPDTTYSIGSPNGRSRILPFLLIPALSAVAWFGFFKAIYGTFNPSVPYGGNTQTSPLNILNGLPGLLFDQQFGILPNAPVYGFCFAGMIALARRRLRLALELSAVSAVYLLSTSAFHMWWGGHSAPARFAVPVLPLLALPGAWLWKSTPSFSTRAIGLAALLVSLATTAVMVAVHDGRLAYNLRDGYARAAEWLSPLVDVPQALPSLFRQTPAGALVRSGWWIVAFLAAVVVLRRLEERLRPERGAGSPSDEKRMSRATLALATPVCLAIAVMLSLTAVWRMDRVEASRPETSRLRLLQHYDTRIRPTGLTTAPLRFESSESILSRIIIATPNLHTQALLLLPEVVTGGRYELRQANPATASGTAALVIGGVARPIKTWNLTTDFSNGSAELELPVNVGSLVIKGDSTTAQPARSLTLHPRRIWQGSSRLTGEYARRAERYGPAVVYFFDDGAFVEEPGFWIRGGGFSQIAAAQAEPAFTKSFGGQGRRPSLQLYVRNAPVVNRLALEIDGHEQILNLQPREERIVPIQIAPQRPAALLRFHIDTGFHPSEVEPGSTDTRFLGVWIEFR